MIREVCSFWWSNFLKAMAEHENKGRELVNELASRAYVDGYGKGHGEGLAEGDEETQDGWIPVGERLPEKERTVLARSKQGKRRVTIRACYIPRLTVESGGEHEEFDEYSEEKDTFYLKEGWYEEMEFWDEYASVHIYGEVTHWRPLPAPPREEDGS